MIDWLGLGLVLAVGALALAGFAVRDPKWVERRDNAAIVFGVLLCLAGVIWLWFARGNFPP